MSNWEVFVDAAVQSFHEAILEWESDFDDLLAQWVALKDDPSQMALANKLDYQVRERYDTTVIETLADKQFLPRYGFPIGLQSLKVRIPNERASDTGRWQPSVLEDRFRLERPSILALREYAPGASVVVGGQQVKSRGLLKHWTGNFLDRTPGMRGYATEGMDGNVYYTLGAETRLKDILSARNTMPRRSAAEILLPKHGFTTAVWDRPRRPTVTELSGRVEIADGTFVSPGESQLDQTQRFESIGGIAGVAGLYRERGTLLVYTKAEHGHGFAICTKCGYAEPEWRSTGAGRNAWARSAAGSGQAP